VSIKKKTSILIAQIEKNGMPIARLKKETKIEKVPIDPVTFEYANFFSPQKQQFLLILPWKTAGE
jgi:hypothetical protein